MRIELPIVRDESRWFVDDPDNGFSHEDNELVSGVPEIIESLIGKAKRGKIIASDKNFKGATELTLTNNNSMGGVVYSLDTPAGKIDAWLCSVFWHYIPSAPSTIYISIERSA